MLLKSKVNKMPNKLQYAVYSVDRYSLDAIPAGEYDTLAKAIAHAETVTYKMAVVDRLFESRGFVYTNYNSTSPKVEKE